MERRNFRFNLFIQQRLPSGTTPIPNARQTINGIDRQRKSIRLIANRKLKRCVDVPLLDISAHMEVVLTLPLIRQPVDQPWVGMEIEYHGFVVCEQRLELAVRQAMRMIAFGNQLEQINHVDETDLDVG